MVVRRHWAVRLHAAWLFLGCLAFCAPSFAQALTPPAAGPPTPEAPPAPSELPTSEPDAAPNGVLEPVQPALPREPAEAVIAEPAASPSPVPVTQPVEEDWYESFDVRMFADAYFGWNFNAPKPQTSGNEVVRAFDTTNGFALAWAGLDVSHAAEPIGGTVALRFGPSAQRYNSSCLSARCDADHGLQNVKQAFASWRPAGAGSSVSLDFGKFDTIYGAEVAESQDNPNYTRGVLFWLGQPLFHTGLRLNAELTQNFSMRALVVNGWNNTIDNNTGKTFGLQATVHARRDESHDLIAASVGYLGGPERDDTLAVSCPAGSVFDPSAAQGCSPGAMGSSSGTVDQPTSNSSGFRHFVDLLLTSDPIDSLHLVLNADYGVERLRDSPFSTTFSAHKWFGAMLGARYLVVPRFALAARGELYRDADGVTTGQVNGIPIRDVTLTTATLTLDYSPSKNLLLRLDNRLDHATRQIFPKGVRELTGSLFSTTLGVVVTTN